jgi:hypothetical protein
VLDIKGRGNNRYRCIELPLFTISLLLIKFFTDHQEAATNRHLPEPVGIGVDDADTDLLECIGRLLRLLDCHRDRPVFWLIVKREVLLRLIVMKPLTTPLRDLL